MALLNKSDTELVEKCVKSYVFVGSYTFENKEVFVECDLDTVRYRTYAGVTPKMVCKTLAPADVLSKARWPLSHIRACSKAVTNVYGADILASRGIYCEIQRLEKKLIDQDKKIESARVTGNATKMAFHQGQKAAYEQRIASLKASMAGLVYLIDLEIARYWSRLNRKLRGDDE